MRPKLLLQNIRLLNPRMKRHLAAALAFAWTLSIMPPGTSPKDGKPHIRYASGVWSIKPGFQTKRACMKAGAKWKSDFLQDAKEKNLDVYGSGEISCVKMKVGPPEFQPK